MDNLRRREYNAIDICKIIMAVCVVALHTHPLENCSNYYMKTLYGTFVDLAVPFFFIASGFLLGGKLDEDFCCEKNQDVFWKSFISFLKMYIIWTILYLPMTIYKFVESGYSISLSAKIFFRGFLFVGEQYNSWPLWYLLSSVYALLLILIATKLKVNRKVLLLFGLIILTVSISISSLMIYEGELTKGLTIIKKLVEASILNGRILLGAFYIPLGIFLQKYPISKWISAIVFAGGFVANIFVAGNVLSSVLTAIIAVGLFGSIVNIELQNSNIYEFVRKMSTVVYFIHMYVWTLYYMIVYGEKTYGADSFIVTTIVSLIIAFLCVLLKKKAVRK